MLKISLNCLRAIQSVLVCLAIIEVIRHEHIIKVISKEDRRHKYTNIIKFILEIIISLIHVPPYIDHGAKDFSDTSYVDILTFLSFTKIYILARLMRNGSPLNTNSGRFIGSFTKVEFGDWFLVKIWMKANPLFSLIASWIVIIFASSYLLYISERKYPVDDDDPAKKFNFLNSIWCIIITILTVGYGDITANTFVGRTLTVVSTFFGLVSSATLIGLISDYLNLNPEEETIIKFIEDNKKIKLYKISAFNCVKGVVRVLLRKKKGNKVNEAIDMVLDEVAKFRYYRL